MQETKCPDGSTGVHAKMRRVIAAYDGDQQNRNERKTGEFAGSDFEEKMFVDYMFDEMRNRE